MSEPSAEHLLGVLNRHGVRYLVIGAFAAIAQGVPLEPTEDVDLTPDRNLTCPDGDFDRVFQPSGAPAGYAELIGRAVVIRIGSEEARAASVADITRSKEEAGREKDIRALPRFRRFLRDRPQP